ncbi:DinB family protein [Salinibacter grassmerensis]|uniref:DinB family protein n=1 Tax=Salinibacter grassmerensis TaxID=3040353 RepID=UPI0021E80048|nr:DinB family protein [Salinibacter grassmerensis]
MPQSRTAGDFRSLFEYDRWASDRLLDTMQAAGSVPSRAPNLLMHLLRAQDVWHGRIESTDHADQDLWVEASLEDCARRAEQAAHRWKRLLDKLADDDLDRLIAYRNSKGTAFETPLREVLSHVVNHGTHHRGQIALLLREGGIAPPPTDYIFYLREQ